MVTKPRRVKDLSGLKFGELTVGQLIKIDRYAHWECMCSCGKINVVRSSRLISGGTKSCGCLVGKGPTTHGECGSENGKTSEYRSWLSMRGRCEQPSHRSYKNYGGRGIQVCSQWESYIIFLLDMGRKPNVDSTIDRIDVDGNYEPSNCRWISKATQQQNKRTSVVIDYDGRKLCAAEWGRLTGLRPDTICARIRSGWNSHDVLTRPSQKGFK